MTENTLNSTAPRADVVDWPEGELPEQMGGVRETLMPGTNTFLIPASIAQLWHDQEMADNRPGSATFQQKVLRKVLKFDRDNPLVVVGGPHAGQPLTATFSTAPRPRGKKDDPKTSWVSDAAYVLGVGLRDARRPATVDALVAHINEYAGKTIRLEHGLSGYCNPNKVRRISVDTAEGGVVVEDPSGAKGCGERFYTSAFKLPEGGYGTQVLCGKCQAVVNGYENVERILPPIGQ